MNTKTIAMIKAGMLIIGLAMSTQSFSSVISYSGETTFQNALTGEFTLINLDSPPLSSYASGYRVEDAAPSANFASLGIDFINVNAQVVDGQGYQIPKAGRDRLIFNGTGFDGNIAFNLLSPVNGIGAWSNLIDGGVIKAYDGLGLSGNLIGTAALGAGSFGGLISSNSVRSVEITCDFNSDLKCGVFDIQFGTVSSVPVPAAIWLFSSGLLALIGFGRNRSKST